MQDPLTLHVRAPIDGTVLQMKSRAGEYDNTLGTEPLLALGDTRRPRVRMDVERELSHLAVRGLSL